MATVKQLKSAIIENLHPDTIRIKRRTGHIFCQWKFLYTDVKTAADYTSKIEKVLTALNVTYWITDCDQVWKNFRGGASTAKQSHFWIEVEILK